MEIASAYTLIMSFQGLRYIFGQFGEISSVFLKTVGTHAQARGNTTWAFVTFDDPLAAMTAMEKVNMNGLFGLQVKLAMSEQEKCDKRMAEDQKEMVDAEQQRRIEAFERTQGIGRQEYPVSDALGGPMEGRAFQLKVTL